MLQNSMPAESSLPATTPPAPLALPFSVRDARREQLQHEYDEAVSRLRRVRQYRFVIYGEIRRCLAVLGDLAVDLVGEERYRELKQEADRLSPEPLAMESLEGEEASVDPALAWMEPEVPPEAIEGPPSLPPAPSSEETSHAARTLRECLEYLDAADRSTPEFHLAILQAEERMKEYERANGTPSPEPSEASRAASSTTPPDSAPPASTS